MRMWGYYAWHTLVNSIKRIFRKEFAVVLVIIMLVAGVFGAGAGFVGGIFFPEEDTEISSEEDGGSNSYETEAAGYEGSEVLFELSAGDVDFSVSDDDNDDVEMTPEELREAQSLAEMVIAFVFILLLLIGIKGGSKDGAQIFTMADVNFLFPSPRKPQTVLMFRMTFTMAAQLCGMAYLLFQIPALAVNLNLSVLEVVIIVLAVIIVLVYMRLASLLSYMMMATKPELKKFMWPFIIGVVAGIIAVTYVAYIASGNDFLLMCERLYASAWSRAFPVIGWMKGLFICAAVGQDVYAVIYLFLLMAGVTVLVRLIWRFDADFYEDALVGAEKQEKLVETAENGGLEQGKIRSKRLRRNILIRGNGASAFFWKEWANRRRFSFLGLFTKTMFVYAAAALIGCMVTTIVADDKGFLLAGIMLFVILFFRTYGNPIATETGRNWLVMVPESPYAKVFFCMMSGTVSTAIDLIPVVVIGLLVSETNPVAMLLWYLDFVALDFMFSALGLMLEFLFPASEVNPFRGLLQFFIKLCMGLLLFVVLLVGSLLVSVGVGLAITLVFAVTLGAVCFLFYPMFLHDGTR